MMESKIVFKYVLKLFLVLLINIVCIFTFKVIQISLNKDLATGKMNKRSNSTLEESQKHRISILNWHCGKMEEGNKTSTLKSAKSLHPHHFRNFLYDDTLKFVYCYIPKVACTNWKRTLLVAQGKGGPTPEDILPSRTHNRKNFQFLSNLSMKEINQRLENFFVFLVVRDPFERLLSAFRDKFEMEYSEYFQRIYGRQIVKKYRKNASNMSLERGNDVTFEEFVRYLLDVNGKKKETLNEHWRPMTDLCHPCDVKYDAIGYYDTLEKDSNFMLKKLHLKDIHFPAMPKHHVGIRKTKNMINRYFRKLTPKVRKKLIEVYKEDYYIFNYTLPDKKFIFMNNVI